MKDMKTKEQTVPKWFKGMIYEEGSYVTNPFSREEYLLNGLELSLYDFIIGSQMVFERYPKSITTKRVNDFHKALTWFRVNNSDAYYTLLD